MTHSKLTLPDRFLWSVIAAWTAVTLTSFFSPESLSANAARFINVGLLSVFTLVHGARRYRVTGIAIYFCIAVVVTNAFENLSIVTGFPFGQYEHMAAMGPKLWHVPLIVGPIFAVAGYLAWVLAGIILGDVFADTSAKLAYARPIIAAFITTSWDLCVDAIGGTFNRDWVWAHGDHGLACRGSISSAGCSRCGSSSSCSHGLSHGRRGRSRSALKRRTGCR
jgi:putative membrane protein